MKHHCRQCAGIFCDDCCPMMIIPSINDSSNKNSNEERICLGCQRGDTPYNFIPIIKLQLENENNYENNKIISKINNKLNINNFNKINDNIQVEMLSLQRGEIFIDDGLDHSIALPISGYFHFINKSNQFCAIKLLLNGSNIKFEIPRPSYIAIPPNGSVSTLFNPNYDILDLYLLNNNENTIIEYESLNFDSRIKGSNINNRSKCAKIDLFQNLSVYSINSKNKNVIIKYKDNSYVTPRNGNSITRVGLLGKLQGRNFTRNKIDYSTNINEIAIRLNLTCNL